MRVAQVWTRLEQAHSGAGGGRDRRRQRRREDEGGRIAANGVDERGVAGDIAAERAKALGQRALDHVDLVHDAGLFANAAAARAVHADRVHLVDIGHRAVTLGESGDFGDRRDIAVHRIEALEHDQLRPIARRDQQLFEMGEVIVAEDLASRRATA